MTDPLKPPLAVAVNAAEGLVLFSRGRGGRGLRPDTLRFARKLARREPVTEDEARTARAWFARFAKNGPAARARASNPESPAMVSWLLHGGDEARTWLEEIAFYLLDIPTRGEPDDP